VVISHASEDKEAIATPLAEAPNCATARDSTSSENADGSNGHSSFVLRLVCRWRSDASLQILSALTNDSTKTLAYLHLILRAGNREIMGKSSEENLPRKISGAAGNKLSSAVPGSYPMSVKEANQLTTERTQQ
jgi:hypothetical protein